MAKKYRVVADLQGGDFGMGRDYTIDEWREQAIEWADWDESDELREYLERLNGLDVLEYIQQTWEIVFEEVKEDMGNQDIVTITCYGTTKQYTRREAITKFFECMLMSEGSEKERYTNIYCGLVNGETQISDEE